MRTGLVALVMSGLLLAGCSDGGDTTHPPTGDPPCSALDVRFADCGNGTVTDGATGLIWLKAANCFDLQNFSAATSAAGSLKDGDCGLTDGSSAGNWRLPTREEWAAVVKDDCTFGSPHLPDAAGDGCWSEGDPFDDVQASAYWSSTAGSSPNYTWIVYLHDAYFIPDSRTDLHYVWPVRDR